MIDALEAKLTALRKQSYAPTISGFADLGSSGRAWKDMAHHTIATAAAQLAPEHKYRFYELALPHIEKTTDAMAEAHQSWQRKVENAPPPT